VARRVQRPKEASWHNHAILSGVNPLNNAASSSRVGERSAPRVEGRRLVLAEDDSDLREMLALAMRREGYEVIELEDGWQLLEYLSTQMLVDGECSSVHVVISDIRMPGKSGLDVLAGVQWAKNPPPFILVSGFCVAQTQAEASRLGAAALVAKPYSLAQIRALVREVDSRVH
jgi:DNA-binding response OmpR family regulator